MAKKRGTSPLGNTPGAAEAQQSAAKANLETLSNQLTTELEKSGENIADYLKAQFGLESIGKAMTWQLASGTSATFNEVTLSHEQVRDNTLVTFDVNGRDQSLLTAESLSDLNSLEFQQFYPAVGREVDGKIDILDGSRRRAWVLLREGKVDSFRVLVTQDDISTADAKALAKQLQTAKEHNQREIGLQCKAIMDSGEYTQEDVAKLIGISRPAVSKALKAASIDSTIIALFPIVNELSHTDYSLLDKVMKALEKDKKKISAFAKKVSQQVVNVQPEQSSDEVKDNIINVIKAELKIVESKQEKDKAEVTPLAQFNSKGMFARKRVKGRNFSYEFGRLSKEVQEKLDIAIASVLADSE
ncbi:ParB/RepB/Spo0J family partition protein [Vibrio parahaemolyticus]|uniref:ParB family protein n=1 Tax=Vibrio parahaemolyticus TaxID=670 RepID=UPI00040F5A7D|nr:ParB family protein [Vibrio parahaemolyticus]EGQ9819067.1 ParB/RepB/Spo0J family partition protein [Vibrio parahaemolyticus]EJL6383417.1 ParB/RepB/Spo0J family partition protein [Vibrio parahaemolyticus]TOB38234.1 chromosome partitioning protein ParB [Vibrio parahaemolyticus]TOC11600.1 chromosome partitioning protein ParB [Vibrio parahaemolyticus]TOD43351.1 chromosome partitioning protein ParB [Vibrio parahaemolyticus]